MLCYWWIIDIYILIICLHNFFFGASESVTLV